MKKILIPILLLFGFYANSADLKPTGKIESKTFTTVLTMPPGNGTTTDWIFARWFIKMGYIEVPDFSQDTLVGILGKDSLWRAAPLYLFRQLLNSGYLLLSDTSTMLSNLLRKTDTADMLSGYARTGNIISGVLRDSSAFLVPVNGGRGILTTGIGSFGSISVSGLITAGTLTSTGNIGSAGSIYAWGNIGTSGSLGVLQNFSVGGIITQSITNALIKGDGSGNFVAATSSDLPGGPYLPLTGGTLSGSLTSTSRINVTQSSSQASISATSTFPSVGIGVYGGGATGISGKGSATGVEGNGNYRGGLFSGTNYGIEATTSNITGSAIRAQNSNNGGYVFQGEGNSTGINSSISALGIITGSSFVMTGGTGSQFLKANGTVDNNTYLTTGSAASTYLALTGGTLTGNLSISKASPVFTLNRSSTSEYTDINFNTGGVNNWQLYTENDATPDLILYSALAGEAFRTNYSTGLTTFSSYITSTGYIARVAGSNSINLGLGLQDASGQDGFQFQMNASETQMHLWTLTSGGWSDVASFGKDGSYFASGSLTAASLVKSGATDEVALTGAGGTISLSAATYYPTLTNQSNISSSGFNAHPFSYTIVGNLVTVYFSAYIVPTAASGTYTALRITLPVATSQTTQSRIGAGTVQSAASSFTDVQVSVVSASLADIHFTSYWTSTDGYIAGSFQYVL